MHRDSSTQESSSTNMMMDALNSPQTVAARRPSGSSNALMRTRGRAIRTVTRPAELLYALGRQWGWIGLAVLVAAAVSWYQVDRMVPVYEGKATIQIEDKTIIDEALDPRAMGNRTRSQQQTMLAKHISGLTSNKVIRMVVENAKLHERTRKKKKVETLPDRIKEKINTVKKEITELLGAQQPIGDHFGTEKSIREAMEEYRRRSIVEPDLTTSSVELTVFGTDTKAIQNELEIWLRSYQSQVKLDNESAAKTYLTEQTNKYTLAYNDAQDALDAYIEKNPELRQLSLEFFTRQIEAAQRRVYDLETLKNQLVVSPLPTPRTTPTPRPRPGPSGGAISVDPGESVEVTGYRTQIKAARDELLNLRSNGYQDGSIEIKRVLRTIDGLEKALTQQLELEAKEAAEAERIARETEASQPPGDESPDSDAENSDSLPVAGRTPEEIRREQLNLLHQDIQEANNKLQKLQLEQVRFKLVHDQMIDLEERRDQAELALANFRRVNDEIDNKIAQEDAVKVRVTNTPQVGLDPVDYRPLRKFLIGCVAGLGIGFLLAIMFEALRSTIRFKQDVIEEFQLPVVGVIPRR